MSSELTTDMNVEIWLLEIELLRIRTLGAITNVAKGTLSKMF